MVLHVEFALQGCEHDLSGQYFGIKDDGRSDASGRPTLLTEHITADTGTRVRRA